MINSTGRSNHLSAKVPYDSFTIVTDVKNFTAQEFGVPVDELPDYGILVNMLVSSNEVQSSFPPENEKIIDLKFSKEMVWELKMRPWTLKVKYEEQAELSLEFSPR